MKIRKIVALRLTIKPIKQCWKINSHIRGSSTSFTAAHVYVQTSCAHVSPKYLRNCRAKSKYRQLPYFQCAQSVSQLTWVTLFLLAYKMRATHVMSLAVQR